MTITIITILQAIVSVFLIILILIQNPSGGLGKTFGSTVYHSRRGLERVTFYLTILTAVILVFLSLLRLII